MKYKTSGNCPYCDSERGIHTPWGMHPLAMEQLRADHDAEHPNNNPQVSKNVLVEILAKCESAKDARECRHIIKEYLLK